MLFRSAFLLLFLAIFTLCICEDILQDDIPVIEGDGGIIKTAIEDDVLILTKENFDIQVSSKDIMLVEFYKRCDHCKTLEPEYRKAAKILKEEGSSIYLAKVDAAIETELASRYDITDFPTLFIFKKGKKFSYDGPRSALGIVEYMKEKVAHNSKLPSEAVITLTAENFEGIVNNADIILVEFYAPWCGHCKALEPEYAKAAKILKEEASPIYLAKLDATIETELASRFDVSGYPTLFIFKKGEKIPYDGPRSALGIVEYMKERADPNWKPPPEAVITLTTENFENIVNSADIILVEFYAPWCGHCKQLAPEYERAAKLLKGSIPPVPLAKIDGIQEKELAEKYEARGWPTLMIFRKGRRYDYEGPRDESGIVSYMKEQAKPPSQEVKSIKVLKNSIGKIDTSIVGYFDSENEPFYQTYLEAANSLRSKFTFLHSFSKDVKKYSGSTKQKIIMYKPELFSSEFEPKLFQLDDVSVSPADISKFIKDNALPLVGERSRKSMWKYQNKYPLVAVYYDVDFSFDHRVRK